ncbi:O-antigen repeat unit transporter [Methanolobus psychrophilus R15]|nr:O-antigen repeat unit transporter [Methanolobus psychrophilus R15]
MISNKYLKNCFFNHKETIHNFTWRALQIFGKQGITFFIFILCAKLLTPHDFGIYNYILAVIYLLIIFGDFGISTATSKYVAEYNATDKDKLKLVLFNSIILVIVIATIVALLTILFGRYFLNENYGYVLYVLPMLFLAPISSLYDGIFRGLKKFKELAIVSLLIGLLSISFVYLLVRNYGLVGALISQSLFYMLLVIVLVIIYGKMHIQFDKQLMRSIFNYSVILGITSIGFYLYSRFDILILGYFGYIEEINSFEIFAKIGILMSTLFTIMGQVIAPNMTALATQNKFSIIHKKFLIFVFSSILCSTFFTFILYILLPIIMRLYYPHLLTSEFLEIFAILIWILPLNMVSGLISQGFTVATGYAKLGLLTIPFGVLNVIMALIFISQFGYIGVAYSSIIVSFTNKGITWFLLYRIFKRNTVIY